MKLLLGCKNIKPWLRNKHNVYGEYHCFPEKVIAAQYLNGKVIAECEFAVEKIYNVFSSKRYCTEKVTNIGLEYGSCLSGEEIFNLLGYNCKKVTDEVGYAIHIQNLHIFDEPKELNDYYSNKELMLEILKVWENFGLPDIDDYKEASFKQFPKNMCYAYDEKESYIFLPVEPEEACRILKGVQTIIIRKTILKDIIE